MNSALYKYVVLLLFNIYNDGFSNILNKCQIGDLISGQIITHARLLCILLKHRYILNTCILM